MKATRIPIADRLHAKLAPQPNGCIEFMGGHLVAGYGVINAGLERGKNVLTHRLAWEMVYGPIPDGMHVCHTCDNPPCCNPDHLFLGTRRDNMQDMVAKKRHEGQRKTRCPHGHPYDEGNTVWTGRGTRECRTCNNARKRARYWARKSKAA